MPYRLLHGAHNDAVSMHLWMNDGVWCIGGWMGWTAASIEWELRLAKARAWFLASWPARGPNWLPRMGL